jgi:hypothetical protein
MKIAREKISKALEAPIKEKGWEGVADDNEFGPGTDENKSLARSAKKAMTLIENLRLQENAGADTEKTLEHIKKVAEEIDQAYSAREARLQKLEDELRGLYPSLDAIGLRDKASALDVLQQTQKAGEENGKKYATFSEDIRKWGNNGAWWSIDKATDEDLERIAENLSRLHFVETENALMLPYPSGEEKRITSVDGMTRMLDPENRGNTPSERLVQWKNLTALANEVRIEGGKRNNEIVNALFGEKGVKIDRKPEELNNEINEEIEKIRKEA